MLDESNLEINTNEAIYDNTNDDKEEKSRMRLESEYRTILCITFLLGAFIMYYYEIFYSIK